MKRKSIEDICKQKESSYTRIRASESRTEILKNQEVLTTGSS
jgi:hypothetical protein